MSWSWSWYLSQDFYDIYDQFSYEERQQYPMDRLEIWMEDLHYNFPGVYRVDFEDREDSPYELSDISSESDSDSEADCTEYAIKKFEELPLHVRKLMDDWTCAICLEGLDLSSEVELTRLHCPTSVLIGNERINHPHIFHKRCLHYWFQKGKQVCPNCKSRSVTQSPSNVEQTHEESIEEVIEVLILNDSTPISVNSSFNDSTPISPDTSIENYNITIF